MVQGFQVTTGLDPNPEQTWLIAEVFAKRARVTGVHGPARKLVYQGPGTHGTSGVGATGDHTERALEK
jgi:hypothetical protein